MNPLHVSLPPEQAGRRAIAFLNWAHAIDHYVMLIYPTVVIGLEVVYGRSYGELIVLSTASFVAFGVFSLPAGWLADHWSRRNMMAAFYLGCGASLVAAGLAPNAIMLAVALFALGMFAAIYHPVGMAMLIEASRTRGRTLAFNGVCGNLGAALAAGITAVLASALGWRAAFFIPAALCFATGLVFLRVVPDDRHHTAKRTAAPEIALSRKVALTIFALFVVVALGSGLTFNTVTVALPKIVDERVGAGVPLYLVGSIATAVFMCGALAQLAVGRLVEWIAPHVLFAIISGLALVGVLWSAQASGLALLAALALTMAAIYGQVTVNDMVIARYTADAWRGRIYAVRYFLIFVSSGAAVGAIAFLYGRGGFGLVLMATAAVTAAFFLATTAIAVLVSGPEHGRARAPQPAE
ncbi:MAG TPA: MFS transporter [Xanthobacteraceae bacterium]|nr:MFS transporter [Xanthobacteraceae bacterium]